MSFDVIHSIDNIEFQILINGDGIDGLNTLFRGDARVVVTQTIIDEIERGPAGHKVVFNEWLAANHDLSNPKSSRIIVVDTTRTIPSGYLNGFVGADSNNLGEASTLHVAASP
jgi:hypothetical protein